MEPRWVTKARSYIGQKEIAGRRHNPQILQWWTLIRAGFTDDETPWCAAFVGGVLESVGIKSTRSAAARSYLKWGRAVDKPVPGCIVVFERGPSAGHVGFVIAKDGSGRLLVLGGNQSDEVNVSKFPMSRVLGYRWPTGEPLPNQAVQTKDSDAPVSRREGLVEVPPDFEPGLEDEPATLSGKIKHWMNFGASGVGTMFAGMFDWRVAAVIVTAGIIVFCIIWFTHMRRR